MNIADRIQSLRKTKGISQEQLADKIGVSRQAVSKWESEQSMPDVEKIILLSNFFDVTTDYLLKGIEPVAENDSKIRKVRKPNAMIFSIIGTAFILIGVVFTSMIWYEESKWTAAMGGIFLVIIGGLIYSLGFVFADTATKGKANRLFAAINIWTIPFIPLSFIYNFLTMGTATAPYPVFDGSVVRYALFWFVFIVLGIFVDFGIYKSKKIRFEEENH